MDDLGAYALFSDELQTLRDTVQWLEVCSPTDTTTSKATPLAIEETNLLFTSGDQIKYSYNLEELRIDEKTLLQSQDSEFLNAVRTISPLTFFAPTDKLALYEFLEISKLSDFIIEEWNICKVTDTRANRKLVQSFTSMMNNLLTFVYAYYYHGGHRELQRNKDIEGGCSDYIPTMLSNKVRMKSLLSMDIVQCSTLQRQLELKQLTNAPQQRTTVEHYQRCVTQNENILYLSSDISVSDMQSLCVNMLMKVIKVEMALIECKQQAAELQQLREELETVAKYTDFTRLLHRLEDQKLSLPEGKLAWRLRVSDIVEEEVVDVVEEMESAVDSAEAEEALRGFENLRQTIRQSTAVVSKKTSTEGDVKYAQYRAEQSKAMKEQGGESAAKAAALGSQNKPTDDTAAAAVPGPAETAAPVKLTIEETTPVARSGAHTVAIAAPGACDLSVSRKVVDTVEGSGSSNGGSKLTGGSAVDSTEVGCSGGGTGTGGGSSTNGGRERGGDGTAASTGGRGNAGGGGDSSGARDSGTGSHVTGGTGTGTGSSGTAGTGTGTGTGGGRYQPISSPPSASLPSSRDVLEITAEELSSLHIEIIDEDVNSTATAATGSTTTNTAAEPSREFQQLISSTHSGRCGEKCAVQMLQKKLLSNPSLSAVPVVAIDWVNETAEAGLPYDIRLTLSDGSYKYCEVKTRSVTADTSPALLHRQWIISPKEVSSASEYGSQYFGVFLNICTDWSLTPPSTQVKDVQIVGLQRGLVQAIVAEHSASLFVQINQQS